MQTVKELIETLKEYPQDAKTFIYSDANGLPFEVGTHLCENNNTLELHCASKSVKLTTD